LQTSSRRNGKLSAAKDAPQRQQTREWGTGDQLSICALPSNLRVPNSADKRYQPHSLLIVMTFACAVALNEAIFPTIFYSNSRSAPINTGDSDPLDQVETAA
jgi:hypothetical protein